MRAVAVTIVALASSPAFAQSSIEERAQAHLDRGIKAFERRDFAAAHAEFLEANKLVPDKANPYRYLALTEVQLGDCASATVNIDAFFARAAVDDERRAEMERLRELCSKTGTLSIRTTPERAQLRIDGAPVGTSPFRSSSFAVGRHTVVAEAQGYEKLARSLVVNARETTDVHLELSRPSTPITRRWWFVPAIVVGAAAVTGAIVLATRDSEDPTTIPGIECDASGCRPRMP
jgi:hypothetical protein